jgi:polysaccharide transporter, PST family
VNGIDEDRFWLKLLPGFIRARIEGRRNLQNILGNTGWLFADRIVRMGVGLFITAWIARYLGPEQFGLFNFVVAFVALFGPLAAMGLDAVVVRNLVRAPQQKDETLGTAFVLKALSGLLLAVAAVSAISLLRPGDGLARALAALIAAGMVFQAFDVIDFWFQSRTKSRFTVIARNSAFLVASVARAALILTQATLVAFAWVGLMELIIAAVILTAALRQDGQRLFAWRPSPAQASSMLRDSWPLLLSGLSIMIYMRIDQVMLGEMAGVKAVGIYTAATKLSELWYFIPTAVISSAFPAIIRLKMENEALYYDKLQKLFGIMTMISVSIAVPMTFLSGGIVKLIYGGAFNSAGPVLAVHIWAAVFVFLGVAQGSWDVSENLTKLSLFRTASGALLNIALNILLIPRYSVIGAAVATIISQAFSAVILNCVSVKTRPIFYRQLRSFLFILPPYQRGGAK